MGEERIGEFSFSFSEMEKGYYEAKAEPKSPGLWGFFLGPGKGGSSVALGGGGGGGGGAGMPAVMGTVLAKSTSEEEGAA